MNDDEIIDNSTIETEEQSTETRDIVEQQFNELESAEEKETQPEEKVDSETASTEVKPDKWRSWKKEAAEELSKLPDNVQKHIADREAEFHKGLDIYKEAATYAKAIDKAISPYKDYLGQLGVTPDVAFPNLLKTEKTLRLGSPVEKAEMFQKLAHDYGIDLRTLAELPYDANLAQYKQQLEWTQNQLQASQDFRQSHEDTQIQGTIEEFGEQHEYFNDVRLDMADLLEKGLATSLEDAYAKATRLNEDVFNKTLAKQQASNNISNLTRADQAAKVAKASAVSVKGSPVGVKNSAVPKTTEDAVRWAMSQHGI